MRFYLDEDLSDQVAVIGRELGLDVVSSHECGRDGLSDEEQLRQAAVDRRIFVTRNYRDFVRLTRQFFESQWPHAGVLFLPRSLANHDFAGIARALTAFAGKQRGVFTPYTIQFLAAD
ncbi:MAG TPA: DUF5615 family PIN-like protein [Chloroflexota bacterium]|jgi:hypothetical protein|nr:DUF5615 family PIN-like protein [Chloroflexota bacterium]